MAWAGFCIREVTFEKDLKDEQMKRFIYTNDKKMKALSFYKESCLKVTAGHSKIIITHNLYI